VRRRAGLAAAGALVLVLAGCGGDDEPELIGGDEAVPDDGAEPTELDPEGDLDGEDGAGEDIDVTVVPDEITEDYVEAVLAELERGRTELLAEFRSSDGEFTAEVMDLLSSLYAEEAIETRAHGLTAMAENDYEGLRQHDELVSPTPEVVELLSAGPDCLFVDSIVDISGISTFDETELERLYLLRLQERELVEDYNATPWVIVETPADVEGMREEDPCA
jgi:hypothetical protein